MTEGLAEPAGCSAAAITEGLAESALPHFTGNHAEMSFKIRLKSVERDTEQRAVPLQPPVTCSLTPAR